MKKELIPRGINNAFFLKIYPRAVTFYPEFYFHTCTDTTHWNHPKFNCVDTIRGIDFLTMKNTILCKISHPNKVCAYNLCRHQKEHHIKK